MPAARLIRAARLITRPPPATKTGKQAPRRMPRENGRRGRGRAAPQAGKGARATSSRRGLSSGYQAARAVSSGAAGAIGGASIAGKRKAPEAGLQAPEKDHKKKRRGRGNPRRLSISAALRRPRLSPERKAYSIRPQVHQGRWCRHCR